MTRVQKTTAVSLLILIIVLGVALVGAMFAERSVRWNLAEHAHSSASQWADTFLIKNQLIDPALTGAQLSEEDLAYFENISEVGNIFKFKILDKYGNMILVSDRLEETGTFEPEPYRPEILALLSRGERYGYSSIHEDKANYPDVYFSAYVPFIRDGVLEAVVETYVDVTATYAQLRKKSYVNVAVLLTVILLGLAHGVYTLVLLHKQRVATRTIFELSRRDPLTGLANRARFAEELGRVVNHASTPSVAALFMIDLDGFKAVNDTHGHATGDALLCAVSNVLERGAPPRSLVARLGGDEFAVLKPESRSRAELEGAAQKLVDAVSTIREVDGCRVDISASVGVAEVRTPNDGEALQRAADRALYEAKGLGKNRFIVCHENSVSTAREDRSTDNAETSVSTRQAA